MAHKIEVFRDTEIIKVTYEGTMTLDKRLLVVHELCCDFNIFDRYKLLIDVRNIEQAMTNFEQEVFGNFIASKEELQNASVAVLDNAAQTRDQIHSETASSLGYRIRQFDDEAIALKWLNN